MCDGVVVVAALGELGHVAAGFGGVVPVQLQHHLAHPATGSNINVDSMRGDASNDVSRWMNGGFQSGLEEAINILAKSSKAVERIPIANSES